MKKRMSVLRLRMGVRIGLKRFFPFGSQNMLMLEGWHSTSTVSGISATSPSMWTVPGSLRMVALGVRIVWIMMLLLIRPVKSSTPTMTRVKGSPECITVMSSTPSWIEAVGAMNALLPYCDALHTATRKAFTRNVASGVEISYSSDLYLR